MGTGTRGIATRADANIKKSGAYTSDLKRCITKSSAIAAGFTVSGSYANNQLVKYSDLSYTAQLIFKLVIDISSESELYNKGPITLNTMGASIRPLSYAREVEATEIADDASGIPLEYSVTHNEEPMETNMTLSTVDEVLQVVQEFEEQDQILAAPTLTLLGMSLTKDDATSTNLLESSIYGPVTVSNKKVTFTLLSTTFSSSTAGTYKLSYAGVNGMYLMNNQGLYPYGALYAGSTSNLQYQTFDVNEGGTWEFNARWVKGTIPTPDPSTPTTYTFRLRFALDGIAVYQVYVKITCILYSSTGTVLGTCSVPGTAYRPYELPADLAMVDTQSYYYIDLWTGTTVPYYVKVSNVIFRHNANNMGNWLVTDYNIQNRSYFGSSPSLSGSGMAYYTLNPRGNIYSVDYLVGGGELRPLL